VKEGIVAGLKLEERSEVLGCNLGDHMILLVWRDVLEDTDLVHEGNGQLWGQVGELESSESNAVEGHALGKFCRRHGEQDDDSGALKEREA